jgi:hypothetical protein
MIPTSVAKKPGTKYCWSLRRFAKNVFLLLILIVIATIITTTVVKATFDSCRPQIIEINVRRGDTLWSIAQKIEPSADPRLVIDRIKEYNQLVTSKLEIGQFLVYQLQK